MTAHNLPSPSEPLAGPTAPTIPWRLSDLRGLAQLGFDATGGVTRLVEQLHGTIAARANPFGPGTATRPERTRGLTGGVYRAVRGTTGLAQHGVDAALGLAERVADRVAVLARDGDVAASAPPAPHREAAIAALNGVWGDHLEATRNPLAIRMAFRIGGRPLTLTHEGLASGLANGSAIGLNALASRRVLVLAHGLCMNDLQWTRGRPDGVSHNHGHVLAQALGCTPVWLHYNSGRHVAHNGQELSRLLGDLVAHWPVPVDELLLLGHSMGGLVLRSACHAAAHSPAQLPGEPAAKPWLHRLSHLACLGTPHHGAALERGGRWLDTLLALSPFVAPFARLGQARSAGITDLRYGNVQVADVGDAGRHAQHHDSRQPTPWPAGVKVLLAAATTAAQPRGLRHALLGDGLVSVASALGEHANPALDLRVPSAQRRLLTSANHWDLLDHAEVTAQLVQGFC